MPGEIFNDFDKPPLKAKKSQEEIIKDMNDAAVLAAEEFNKEFADWSARDVVGWWAKWYLKAGHKRLGRIMVAKSRKPS